jgi:glycosyltransferase involved in cell wall biosynthesis
MKNMVVGIDAINIRQGGGFTHLFELLNAADPVRDGIEKCIVWTGAKSANRLPRRDWLTKLSPSASNGGFLRRTMWQTFCLSREARKHDCDILLVPGGSFCGRFRPVVSISQNLLPFESDELSRYGFSRMGAKMRMLRYTQSRTFRRSDGVIFLTQYALDTVANAVKQLPNSCIIPHGINSRFFSPTHQQKNISEYCSTNPYRIIYVSTVDVYKHQWIAVEAVSELRKLTGWHVSIEFAGNAYPPSKKKLETAIAEHDPKGTWAKYLGPISFDDLHKVYERSQLAFFGSSCENMPCILLEMMASGLPVCSSNRGPMPEMVGTSAVFFEPESRKSMIEALAKVISSKLLRESLSLRSRQLAEKYSWASCAEQTFGYLRKFVK